MGAMNRAILASFWLLASYPWTCMATSSNLDDALQQPVTPPAFESPLLHLHRQLVSRESITGNEAEVGQYIVAYLEGLGYKAEKQLVGDFDSSKGGKKKKKQERANILAYAGESNNTRILLSSHIDVVPPYYPYELRNDRKEIWGRGSVDAKACVAAQIQAFHELIGAKEINKSDVGLLFVVGEEEGGDGMKAANKLGKEWEAVIFGEPTEGKLAAGHKGIMSISVKAKGQAAHSGYPWLGQSANDLLIAALSALEKLKGKNGTENGGLPYSDKYGATTLNVGLISGGVAKNVVAEQAEARLSLRIAKGEPEAAYEIVAKTVKDATDKLVEKHGEKKGSVEVVVTDRGYGPVQIDTDIPGFDVITVNYGTDVPSLKGKHKRYLYGPGSILVAHSDHEHLKVNELYKAVEDYKKIIKTVLDR